MLTLTRIFRLETDASATVARTWVRGEYVTGLPWSIALIVLLAACAQDRSKTLNLSVACETEVCDCAKDSGYTAKPPSLLWRTDGTAYCPDGYHLHMKPPPSQRMTVQ